MQQKRLVWIGKFCQGGNQISTVGALNNKFVAGEFPIQSKPRPGNPDQRMKPKRAKAKFVNKAYQVVASSCVCQLVDEDGVEFVLTQHAVNTVRK